MLLTDREIKNFKTDTNKKLSDGEGLYLLVKATGSKCWRLKYRYLGKENVLALGVYPEISLTEARDRKIEARKLLREGKDPAAEKREKAQAARIAASDTFEAVALEWYNLNQHDWSAKYKLKVLNRLKRYAFPKIGNKPINLVKSPDILELIRPMEADGHTEASHKLYQNCHAILQLAFASGRIPFVPLGSSRGILKSHKPEKTPTIRIDELPEFLNSLKDHNTGSLNKLAIKLLMLCFTRTIELRKAKWEQFDLPKGIWKIPAENMKMGIEHWVPLSTQAINLLKQIHTLSGNNEYLFPTKNLIKHPYMNENVINKILSKMGYTNRLTGHGFRSLASTTLNELGFNRDVIEKQLAHEERNQVRAAYNRAEYLPQRIELMQAWADHIDKVCLEADLNINEKFAA